MEMKNVPAAQPRVSPVPSGNEGPHMRRYVRVEVAMAVAYAREGEKPVQTATCNDLGGGGIRMATDEDLPLGAILALHFALPGLPREILARGRIVLSFYSAVEKRFFHGIAFTQIDPRDKDFIVAYVEAEVDRQGR